MASIHIEQGTELAAVGPPPPYKASGPTRVLVSHPSSTAFPDADAPKKSETDLPAAYLAYLDSLRAAWTDLPDLTISYSDLTYAVQVPVASTEIPNLATAFRDGIKSIYTKAKTREFVPLGGANGMVRPGELTLVLAPPGHGKSVLLKALAGRLERESENLKGEIRWNGLNAEQSKAAGQELSKLCVFVEQGDVHYPILTVRETFQFALDNSNADSAHLGDADFSAKQAKKVELMLELLGLKECADTVVGNGMLRGVSGGQKKRVTLGEMMISQARALFLDEISTGLDSAATFDIVSALKKWTRVMRGSATVALLQPAPEVAAMFDNIILLREGSIVFSGTWAQLKQHFLDINVTPNPDIDFADWLTEFLTDPVSVWKRDIEQKGRQSSMRSFRKSFREEHPAEAAHVAINATPSPVAAQQQAGGAYLVAPTAQPPAVVFHLGSDNVASEAAAAEIARKQKDQESNDSPSPVNGAANGDAKRAKGLGQIVSATGIPLTTLALRSAYESSRVFQDLKTEISDSNNTLKLKAASPDKTEVSAFTRAQFYQAQSWSVWYHTMACLRRQYMFMTRSPEFVIPRIGQSVFMGLVMGSLFYQIGTGQSDFSPRIGLILFSIIFMAFANMSEIPLASEFKLVVYKQVDAGFYSTFSYVCSVILMHLPLAIAEVFVFGTILYWMAGFADDAGRYFFHLLVMLFINLSVSALFRSVAYVASNPDVAMNLAGPSTAVCLLFGGFLITADKIPNWLIWVFYLSPFSWGLRSNALNEFKDSRYAPGVGDAYLKTWQISRNDEYKWAGVAYLAGLFIFFILLSAAALKYKRSWLTVGTRRIDLTDAEAAEEASVEVRIGAKTTSMVATAAAAKQHEDAQQLTFTKMDISFIDLKYEVTVTTTNEETGKPETTQRQLLQGINGFARAGELTALMGSSGAGKTTLMDVIAGRKTSGKITGQILIDGHPQVFPSFNRLMGYCEQTDVHVGTDTVREAIEFSAKLRLPATVTDAARTAFVDQILEDLELTPIAGRMVGDANIEGLSPGQLKRLTIGVELAANPTFLFLDEPTSGLDSRAALIVCRVIRKIARRGRAVVCTIHQPSSELFGMFDRLLLLKSGGKEVYFGPIGEGGVDVVSYFMTADIDEQFYRPSLPDKVNPASWMLDVIGAGTSAKGKIAAYDEVYRASPLRVENMAAVQRLSTPSADKPAARFDGLYASNYGQQLYHVLHRMFTVYFRDTSYNAVKFFMMGFLGILFGLVYRDISDDDEAGMISKVSVMYMACGFMGVLQSSNALPVVFRLREVFYRERASNTYAPWVYTTGLMLVELPYLFVCTCLFVLPFYLLVHFEYEAEKFFQYLLIMYLEAVLFCYMGQMFASLMPNIQVANIIQGLCFTFFFLFGGTFIQKGAMPIGWQWMYYIGPIPKGVIPLAIQQFYCVGPSCATIVSTQLGGITVTKWQWVSQYLATGGPDWDHYYIGYLILSIVVVAFWLALVIQKVSHLKR